MPEGKTSKVHDTYKEAFIPMQETQGDKRLVNLRVRAFNDGIAFRYEFPVQANWKEYTIQQKYYTQNKILTNPVPGT